jgi:hypothetical protein
MTRKIRFTKNARKHKIGQTHALFVIENNEPMRMPRLLDYESKLFWIGVDDRGLELEITGIESDDEIFVIHVMPTAFIKRGRDEY